MDVKKRGGRGIHFNAIEEEGLLVTLYEDPNCAFKWGYIGYEPISLRVGEGREALIACMRRPCTISLGEEEVRLQPKDLLYVSGRASLKLGGRGSLIVVGEGLSGEGGRASFTRRFRDVKPFTSGLEGYRRDIYTLVGEGDPTNSLMAGFTEGWPGEWTSFPPHRHDDKVEIYVYYGLGRGYGVQIVEDEEGVDVFLVRDYDAVVIVRGYHPNVATPGSRMCYLWILCQIRGAKSMKVEFHPDFRELPVGKSHLIR